MTPEQKELLLKDLCARLPYEVKCEHMNWNIKAQDYVTMISVLYGITDDTPIFKHVNDEGVFICESEFAIVHIKPYLFPLSSMTEEQKSQYSFFLTRIIDGYDSSLLIDWLNKNRFDYRGLIPMGLAIDATGLNIY